MNIKYNIVEDLQKLVNKLYDKYSLEDEILEMQTLLNECRFENDLHNDEFVQ